MRVEDASVEDIARMDGFEATGLAGLRDPVAALECSCMCHTRRFGLPTNGLAHSKTTWGAAVLGCLRSGQRCPRHALPTS